MKYVILIHSNPDPWGHPTQQLTTEGRALPAEQHAAMDREFDALLEEISASGELVSAEALGDPASSTLFGWTAGGTRRHGRAVRRDQGAAGRLLHHRLRDPAAGRGHRAKFAQPGGVIELRPVMWPGGDDA